MADLLIMTDLRMWQKAGPARRAIQTPTQRRLGQDSVRRIVGLEQAAAVVLRVPGLIVAHGAAVEADTRLAGGGVQVVGYGDELSVDEGVAMARAVVFAVWK